jgi:HK97 gp10 family phage protein
MGVKIDKSGLDRLRKNADGNASKMVRSLAFQVEALAKQDSPKDTGTNASTIYTKTSANEAAPANSTSELPNPPEHTAYVGPSTEYGIYLELGTENMAARPYLVPALRRVEKLVKGEAKKIVE